MSANNGVHILGRLTADPELKTTASGISVCAFSVAVQRSYVKKGEERQADFIDCAAWRNTAEFICRYFSKGDLIGAEGELQSRMYEDKNGNRRKALEVNVTSVCFGGKSAERKPEIQNGSDFEYIGNDDLPF